MCGGGSIDRYDDDDRQFSFFILCSVVINFLLFYFLEFFSISYSYLTVVAGVAKLALVVAITFVAVQHQQIAWEFVLEAHGILDVVAIRLLQAGVTTSVGRRRLMIVWAPAVGEVN